jgi:hypothetical protein
MTLVEFDLDIVQNPALSYRARGVLLTLLPLPAGARLSAVKIADAGTEGRDAVITALHELESLGLVHRRGKGFFWDGDPTRWLTRPE